MPSKMKFTSEITVDLIAQQGDDATVLSAARVSTKGQIAAEETYTMSEVIGTINYLMQHRHGTPFEHNMFKFFVHAPIFVWREWHRHRIGFSYNEESARYKQLDPVFYIPPPDRPMFKVDDWKPGRPKFTSIETDVEAEKYNKLLQNLKVSYEVAYESYQNNLYMGFDPGLARDCLPVGIYASCWVTCNARSLMSFLSLRTHEPDARDVSYPLFEIEVAARKIEEHFADAMPVTHASFQKFGRRAP